mmetsp:Transcript_14853/g.49999  ORF Transcript_14853/g.49999 Transcript_14853/m.49999 type:complete len:278 (+) Transcript_14853:343-1176(+)
MRRRVYASLFSGACRLRGGARLPLRPHRREGSLRGAHPCKGADGAALRVGGPHGAAATAPAPARGGGECRQQRGDAARRPRSRLLLPGCPDSRGGLARVPLGAAQHAAAARRDAAAGDTRGWRLRPCPRLGGRAQGPPRPGAIARLGPTLQPGGGDAAHVPEVDPLEGARGRRCERRLFTGAAPCAGRPSSSSLTRTGRLLSRRAPSSPPISLPTRPPPSCACCCSTFQSYGCSGRAAPCTRSPSSTRSSAARPNPTSTRRRRSALTPSKLRASSST